MQREDQRFGREEKLKSSKEIGLLFKGKSQTVSSYPLRLVFRETEQIRGASPFQAGFVVPKRKFKKAVDRNLLKRRIREAYRLNKSILAGTQAPGEPREQYALLFIYTGKEEMNFRYVEKKMKKVLGELASRLAVR